MKFKMLAVILLFFISTLSLVAQEKKDEEKKPEYIPDYKLHLGLVAWTYFQVDADAGNVNYGVSRFYFRGKKAINDNVGIKFILDGYLEGSSGDSDARYGAALKEMELWAKIRFGQFEMRGIMGIIETPIINYFGRLGRNLPYYEDPIQTHSVVPGNDLGFGACFSYDNLISLVFTATNGNDVNGAQRGYQNLEPTNGNFLYALRLSVTPIKQVTVSGFYFHDMHDDLNGEAVGFFTGGVAWKDAMLTGGINYTMEVVGDDDMILDFWVNYNLNRDAGFPLKIYLQFYSMLVKDTHEINFGVGYQFAPGTDIALFYKNQFDNAGAVTLHVTTSF